MPELPDPHATVTALFPADVRAELARQQWQEALGAVAAMREAFYDLAPPDVQAAFDVLTRLEAPDA